MLLLPVGPYNRYKWAYKLLTPYNSYKSGHLPAVTTPPKTNMEPKNVEFEDDFPFQRGDFQVPC